MASTAVGIDIGSRTITMAEVKGGRGNPSITNFGGVELSADCAREGEVLDVAATAVALKELITSTKVRGKGVHLGVANQRVVVRQIDLPWVEPKELKASLRYQVQEHLPIPVEDAELDVHVGEEFTNDDGQRFQRLLLVAAHRDMVAAHVEVARQAGLKPVSIDLNSFAALRAIGSTTPGEHGYEVVIDVGAEVTDIVVHDAGLPTFVRILALGGNDITSALATELELSLEDAEARKRELGIDVYDTSDDARQVINARAERFVDEVRSSLDYYQAQSGSLRLANVILTGGGALLGGLSEHLSDKLRLPVEVGSVFDHWPVEGTVYGTDDLARVGPNLAVPVGLALGGLE